MQGEIVHDDVQSDALLVRPAHCPEGRQKIVNGLTPVDRAFASLVRSAACLLLLER